MSGVLDPSERNYRTGLLSKVVTSHSLRIAILGI